MMEYLMPVAASEHAAEFDAVLRAVHAHMAVQAIAWGAFFIYCLARFRRSVHPRAAHRGMRPLLPALAIAGVIVGDALLLAGAALPVWLKRATLPPASAAPLDIRVVAEQFAWHIHYPGPDGRFGPTAANLISASNPLGIDRKDPHARDDVGLSNILMIPVNRPVVVQLTSRDVVHSFTLNEMRVRQDATPGLLVRTWFTPTRLGTWDIACSQLCGLGHYRMRGSYSVLSEDDWIRWLDGELARLTPTPAQP
jgi:cytochrome c oxidase subunit II